jgi:20S proteasome alpha/beta subunit
MTLTELVYSEDLSGTLRVYVYTASGDAYLIRQYFARRVRYSDEEVDLDRAKAIVDEALRCELEVRITNGGDFLVFHSKDGAVLYPEGSTTEKFFEAIP